MEVVGLLLDQGADVQTKDNVRIATSILNHDIVFFHTI